MHLLVRETGALEDAEAAIDLGHGPADLVLLSFSDADLGAAAQARGLLGEAAPRLSIANLAVLRHPMSVDLYLEATAGSARCVIARLLGGVAYWRYGIEELHALCRSKGIALVVLPADGRPDPALEALCTVPSALRGRFDALLGQGGAENMARALRLAAHAGGLVPDPMEEPQIIPLCGDHPLPSAAEGPVAALVFYRSHLVACDIAPIEALAQALAARGMRVAGLFVASLKEPQSAGFIRTRLAQLRPAVVISATAFSATGPAGSPLDVADAAVLQVILAGCTQEGWTASPRGLSPADLAMHVVLPELDGRLAGPVISFKTPLSDGQATGTAMRHAPDPHGIARAADMARGWARLAETKPGERRVMLLLSDYPNTPGQIAHAVGLDALASAVVIADLLRSAGYEVDRLPDLAQALTASPPTRLLSAGEYASLFATLPASFQARVIAAWGPPAGDIALRLVQAGHLAIAVEPDRGSRADRKSGYHDPDLPPAHAHIGFHLWRRYRFDAHALIHLGAHGALEWLPARPVGQTERCFPQALLGATPVIYPYIVNNPGEAACASRRLGAVTIGHLTPQQRRTDLTGEARRLERLIEEYAQACDLDRPRAARLHQEILQRADTEGLLDEAGCRGQDAAQSLARLDAYLCDLKEMQIADGLHVFATSPADQTGLLAALSEACPTISLAILAERLNASPKAEATALLAALEGRHVAPGPAGSPLRGRADVLPTGRNLAATDPRAMPTETATRLAARLAADLLTRHRQEHGEDLRRIVIDVWGSANLRTGGEDIALALHLLGAKALWDAGTGRVTGFEVLPLALLDRPRVDVVLRVSGLFRDMFETQIALFDAAMRRCAAADEAADWNPLAGTAPKARVFGQAPGAYGAGVADALARDSWRDAAELGQAYLDASATAYGGTADASDGRAEFAALVASADAFLHPQDQAETDLLAGPTAAGFIGGFAAAATMLGNTPALYHADTANLAAPRVADLASSVRRILRGRAANPDWIAGQMRHGYRGAGEIARSVQALAAFAATLPTRLDRQFDLLFDATLGAPDVDAFLRAANPDAHADITARFASARARGLWRPRRNDIGAQLGQDAP